MSFKLKINNKINASLTTTLIMILELGDIRING